MIKKDYLAFAELAERWGCESKDIHYLISERELVPSIVWNGPAVACRWADDDGTGVCLNDIAHEDVSNPEVVTLRGWVFLKLPRTVGPYRYRFSFATHNAYASTKESGPDAWFRLIESRHDYRTAEVESEWLEMNSVFMLNVVEDCELVFQPGLIPGKTETVNQPRVSMAGRGYVSDKLATLNQAATRWWANADRNDASTHPTNAAVAAWLIDRGFSETLADKAATIVRPEWAPTGRKSDK